MTATSRAPRCIVLDVGKNGANRCTSEATDEMDAVPMCVTHRIRVLGDLARVPGVQITITAQPTERTTP